jgi:hypothetical protein
MEPADAGYLNREPRLRRIGVVLASKRDLQPRARAMPDEPGHADAQQRDREPAAAIDRAKTSVPSISVAALTARSLTGAAPLCRTRLDTFVDTEARKPRG